MKYMIRFLAVIMIFVLSFGVVSCQVFHECSFGEWTTITEPTVTKAGLAERTCECGKSETKELPEIGIATVKKLLQGSWKNESNYVYVKFVDDSFVAGMYVLGEEYDILQYTGTYSITDTIIILTENDGDTFDVMTFKISNSVIELFSSSGANYTKY